MPSPLGAVLRPMRQPVCLVPGVAPAVEGVGVRTGVGRARGVLAAPKQTQIGPDLGSHRGLIVGEIHPRSVNHGVTGQLRRVTPDPVGRRNGNAAD